MPAAAGKGHGTNWSSCAPARSHRNAHFYAFMQGKSLSSPPNTQLRSKKWARGWVMSNPHRMGHEPNVVVVCIQSTNRKREFSVFWLDEHNHYIRLVSHPVRLVTLCTLRILANLPGNILHSLHCDPWIVTFGLVQKVSKGSKTRFRQPNGTRILPDCTLERAGSARCRCGWWARWPRRGRCSWRSSAALSSTWAAPAPCSGSSPGTRSGVTAHWGHRAVGSSAAGAAASRRARARAQSSKCSPGNSHEQVRSPENTKARLRGYRTKERWGKL